MKRFYIFFVLAVLIIYSAGCQPKPPATATGSPPSDIPGIETPADGETEQPDEAQDEKFQETVVLEHEAIKLMNAHKFDEALKAINKAIDIDHRGALLSRRAFIYLSLKKYKDAEKDLKEAIKLTDLPKVKAISYGQLADIYNEQGEDEKSLEAIREFEKYEPELSQENLRELPVVYGTMGTILADNGEYDRAIKCFDKAIAKEPGETSRLLYERAYAYYRKGDHEKAKEGIQEWLKTNPESKDNIEYRSLGNAYMIKGEYDKALDYINKAMKKEPDDVSYYNDRAYIYIMKGDKESAKKDIDKVLKEIPDKDNWERKLAEKLLKSIK